MDPHPARNLAAIMVVFSALLAAALAKAPPAIEPRAERDRLDDLKIAEINALRKVVLDDAREDHWRADALRRIASLGTSESVRLLEDLYDGASYSAGPWDKAEIARLLGATERAEAIPQLLIASCDMSPGVNHRWTAAEALARIQGRKALPRLREMMNDEEESVRRTVRLQLLRLGDEATIRAVIAELGDSAHPRKLRQALSDISAAHVTAAAPAVHDLFVSVDGSKDGVSLELKLRAGEVSISLGNVRSIPALIELADIPSQELVRIEARSPAEVLKSYTGQDFGTDREKWRKWWSEQPADFRLLDHYMSDDERLAISRAVLAWARAPQSGAYITASPVYLEKSAHPPGLEHGSVRLYSAIEIELLGKVGYDLRIHRSNGSIATARISQIGTPMLTKYYILTLGMKDQAWRVTDAIREVAE